VGTIDEIVVRGDRGMANTRVAPTMNEPAKALRSMVEAMACPRPGVGVVTRNVLKRCV
jgi:hypothetical protein